MSEDGEKTSGLNARLRPRARIMRTLGDELISSEVVAAIELVKNAYDADARRVLVRFHPPLEAGRGGIDIIDDGHGMSTQTVEGAWLEPATPYRRRQNRSEALDRRVLGEKGIGRFAVSRLANELELVTKREGHPKETSVLLDWSLFDSDEAYLDEIEIVIEEANPFQFTAGGPVQELWNDGPGSDPLDHGTLLRMTSLRVTWGEQQLVELRNGLSRLVSPYLFEETHDRQNGFCIDLEVPDYPELSGSVEPPETIRNSPYSMQAKVNDDGSYEATIRIRSSGEEITKSGKLENYQDRRPECGAFDLELRVWDRDRDSIAEQAELTSTKSSQVRKDLNESAGVSIYRDGFRVLPYGERGNDWLSLDSRRVNNPTLRLSNNQVVGFVFISGEHNPDLRDQTNREGLIDNQALQDLREELRGLFALIETERYTVRRPKAKDESPRPDGLFGGVSLNELRSYASEKYPDDQNLVRLLGETQEHLDQGVERVQEAVSRYRRLATLGELIDKVLHDGRAPLGKIGNEAELALRDLERGVSEDLDSALRKRIDRILEQRGVLRSVFKRIEPFGGRRRGRPTKCELEDVVRDSVGVLDGDFEAIGARVDLPDSRTEVTVDQSELQQVFVNLLRNSLYWLRQVPKADRAVRIEVSRDDDGTHIDFSDSGPGVDDEIRDRIFEPYFSTSTDGIGLGLSIAGEIVAEYYGGELLLLDSGPLPGATFRVTLRHRV